MNVVSLGGLSSAQGSALTALANSSQQLSQSAQQIANPDNQDLTSPLLAASQSLILSEAGAAVLNTSNQMLGTLLNIFA
ncbi:MAG: hypothetical protein WB440_16985 [Steroidobacteraceae bacterium]|jgi:hypothetical protein